METRTYKWKKAAFSYVAKPDYTMNTVHSENVPLTWSLREL